MTEMLLYGLLFVPGPIILLFESRRTARAMRARRKGQAVIHGLGAVMGLLVTALITFAWIGIGGGETVFVFFEVGFAVAALIVFAKDFGRIFSSGR